MRIGPKRTSVRYVKTCFPMLRPKDCLLCNCKYIWESMWLVHAWGFIMFSWEPVCKHCAKTAEKASNLVRERTADMRRLPHMLASSR